MVQLQYLVTPAHPLRGSPLKTSDGSNVINMWGCLVFPFRGKLSLLLRIDPDVNNG